MGRRRTTERMAVFGTNAVEAMLRAGAPVERVLVVAGRVTEAIVSLARQRGVRVEASDRPTLDRIAETPHHQGAVALMPPFDYADFEDVAASGRAIVVLDSVQDPRNLGAILRTARAAGVGGVVLPQDRSVGVTAVVVAASAGCLFGLPIARVVNLVRAMASLKASGYWLVGLVPRAERSIFELAEVAKPALVVGGEGEGLRPLVRRSCDFEAALPMAAGVESLNVSVATGIALYEIVVRPRRHPG